MTLDLAAEAALHAAWATLDAAGQAGLAQLAVFPAPFTRTAAESIVVPPTGAAPLAQVLDSLVARGLLAGEGTTERFSLPDAVRAFLAPRLPDPAAVALRHAQYYAKLAAHAEDDLYLQGGAAEDEGLRLFDAERAHIDAGWAWALDHAGSKEADTLLLDLANATVYIGQLRYDPQSERIPQIEAALAAAQRTGQQDYVAVMLGNLGNTYLLLDRPQQAIGYYEQQLAITRALDDQPGQVNTLSNLGDTYLALGDAQQAVGYFEQQLAITRALGDARDEGTTLGTLGRIYRDDLEQPARALDYYQQALVVTQRLADPRAEGSVLNSLGITYERLDDPPRAIAAYEQHRAIAEALGDAQAVADSSWNLGGLFTAQGDMARALPLLQVAVDHYRAIGHPHAEGMAAGMARAREAG